MAAPLIYKFCDVSATVKIGGELHDFAITIDNTTNARIVEAKIMREAFAKFGGGPDIHLVQYMISTPFEAYGADPSLPPDRQITKVICGAWRNANSSFWKTRDDTK